MNLISRRVFTVLATGAIFAAPAGVLAAGGGQAPSHEVKTAAAEKYLARTRFANGPRQGVIEAVSKKRSSGPMEFDLLVSIHGLQPNVAYRVAGSTRACARPHVNNAETFAVDLPVSAADDSFLEDKVAGSNSIKRMRSARIFENGVETGCMRTTVYTFSKF